ncbi:hypothetical protein WQE_26010, partial [Paraburkholderia hospita]
MKLSDLSFPSNELVRFDCDYLSDGWQTGEPVRVIEQGDGYLISQGALVCAGAVNGNTQRVALQVRRGQTQWVLRSCRDGILQLQSLELVEHVRLDMSIAVDEAMVEQLADKGEIAAPQVDAALAWFAETFIVSPDWTVPESGRLLLGRFENPSEDSFVLFGAGWRAMVRREKGALRLTRVTRLRGPVEGLAMVEGRILFEDGSVAAHLQSPEQRARLDAALRDNGSYLSLWQQYGELEWEQARDCARQLGSLRYRGPVVGEGERWEWFLKTDHDQLGQFRARWKSLGLTDAVQVEIGETELDLDAEPGSVTDGAVKMQRRPLRGKLEFRKDGVVLVPAQDRRTEYPPATGFIYFSLSGNEAVQNRRTRAKQSIDAGRRLPQLRYLLEGVVPPAARHRQLPGMSDYAEACFRGEPTKQQKDALYVAINTPDIALIVGPPGTGKTQVIAALQRRLAETLGSDSLQHQVLISSYQHDAVDNAINRAEVFGLPAVRIGGRQRRNEGGVDPVGVWCERKRTEIAVELDSMRHSDPLTGPLEELDRRMTALRLARLSQAERWAHFGQVDALLRQLATLEVRLPPATRSRWDAFLASQMQAEAVRGEGEAGELSRLLRLVRALRITATGFADDGSDRAYQLERALRRGRVELEAEQW